MEEVDILKRELTKLREDMNELQSRKKTDGVPKTVYISKEHKLQKFCGWPIRAGDIDVHVWLEDARRAIRNLPGEEAKVNFLWENLAGEALDEVRMHKEEDRNHSDKILSIIESVYSNTESVAQLQQRFYQRNQRENESLQAYTLALMKLMNLMIMKDKNSVGERDTILIERFIDGVRERQLHRELRKYALDKKGCSFEKFREEVLEWTEDASASVSPHGLKTQQTCVSNHKVTTDDVMQGMVDMLKNQQELLQRQQRQMDRLEHQFNERRPPYQRGEYSDKRTGQGERGGPSNNIRCFKCGGRGHIAIHCTSRREGTGQVSTPSIQNARPTGDSPGSRFGSGSEAGLNGQLPRY